MDLADVVKEAHDTAVEKGFWIEKKTYARPHTLAISLALIHSEVSEALEEARKPEFSVGGFAEELADIIIRVGDLAGYLGVDLDAFVMAKMERNKARPHRHGKRF